MTVCLVYLDDILVQSKTFEEHIANLKTVFQRLQKANLKLAPDKTFLFQKEVTYLGHVISKNGIAANPEKAQLVKTWPHPTDCWKLKQFLGLCSYYRQLVPSFAPIAAPLHALTQGEQRFHWSQEAEQVFCYLKTALTSPPVLGYPDQMVHTLLTQMQAVQGLEQF